jgi:hypothetical protein
MEVINKLIDTEEALANQFDHDDTQDADTTGAAGVQLKVPKATFRGTHGRRALTFDVNVDEFNAVLDNPCTFHEGGTHTVCEC